MKTQPEAAEGKCEVCGKEKCPESKFDVPCPYKWYNPTFCHGDCHPSPSADGKTGEDISCPDHGSDLARCDDRCPASVVGKTGEIDREKAEKIWSEFKRIGDSYVAEKNYSVDSSPRGILTPLITQALATERKAAEERLASRIEKAIFVWFGSVHPVVIEIQKIIKDCLAAKEGK